MHIKQLLRRFTPRTVPASAAAILVAAGSAARMGGIDKVMADLGGKPLIVHALQAFERVPRISEIVVVTRPDLLERVSQLCQEYQITKVRVVIQGGDTRTESVQCGLDHLSKEIRLVAIHDAARPLIEPAVIEEALAVAGKTGAAAPALPVKDTIKVCKGDKVVCTPDRSKLRAVQTPQCFDCDLLRGALQKAKKDGISLTDDCSAMEHLGMRVHMTAGSERNFKVTTPLDLQLARLLLEQEETP